MITFMTVIIHFCRMYICFFHILKEIFEEFHDKMVWSTQGTYNSCLMIVISSIIHHVLWFPRANSRFSSVMGQKRTTFLVLALDPTLLPVLILALDLALRPTLLPAQKCRVTWRLWYWRPMMGKLGTWVLFMLSPSSYWAPNNSVSVAQEGDYWLALFYQLGHHLL